MPEVERRQPEHVPVPAVETPVESAAAQQRFLSRGAVPPPAADATTAARPTASEQAYEPNVSSRSATASVSTWTAGGTPAHGTVTPQQVIAEERRLARERNDQLRLVAAGRASDIASADAIRPEDLTIRPRVYEVVDADDTTLPIIRDLVRIGLQEGFTLVVRSSDASFFTRARAQGMTAAEQAATTLIVDPGLAQARTGIVNPWVEDGARASRTGQISITPDADGGLLRNATNHARDERQAELAARGTNVELRSFGVQGNAAAYDTYDGNVARGLVSGQRQRLGLAYLEGGNVVSGRMADGTVYALVGRDSIAIARANVQRDASVAAGQPVTLTDHDVRTILARDLGVDPAWLLVIDQPGAYHIDMVLKPLGPGVIMINDARMAAAVQYRDLIPRATALLQTLPAALSASRAPMVRALGRIATQPFAATVDFAAAVRALPTSPAWAQRDELGPIADQLEAIASETETRAPLEDLVAGELAEAGLRVIRAPGRFVNSPVQGSDGRPAMVDQSNFMNGEGGTNAAGEQFYITQGAPLSYRQAFEAALHAAGQHPRIHYLDEAASTASLDNEGGVNCRVVVSSEHDER